MNNILRLLNVYLLINFTCSILTHELYQFGEDLDEKLPQEDDFSTEEIVLKSPFVFFGQTYFSIFINTNGLLSFLTEIPYFYNSQFPLDYPTIAPFYSDVDLTEGGNIWYRETSNESTLYKLRQQVRAYFTEYEDFQPESAFIVTWDAVGGFRLKGGKKNTFQVVLVTNQEESFIIFNYLDGGLQWLQGGGKTSGLPDAIAQAGLISEDKRLFSIKGSGTDQVRNLDRWTNTGNPGVWAFRVGQIEYGRNIEVPNIMQDSAESSYEYGEISIKSCSIGGEICHSLATCHDYSTGFCCHCKENFYGNGHNCLRKDEPIRVTGKVNGNINGIDIVEADLHSYVLSNEGRTYTAASRVQKDIGYDLQSLVAIGEGIAWMFAVPQDNVKNGFILTGGVFNRSVEINFPHTGHKAFVHQVFQGLDVFSNVAVSTTIRGWLPSVPFGSEIQVDAFQEEITKVHQGKLRARSNRSFRLKGQTLTTPFSVETFIDYTDCPHEDTEIQNETLRLKIADNIFIRYDETESIVRYSFSAKIGTLEEVDPCIEGKNECGPNSQCIVDTDTFRCVCEQGFDYMYDSLLNLTICMDMNECELARDRCDPEAICINSPGSYVCQCRQGFVGNGYYCDPETTCENANCHSFAHCEMIADQPRCQCFVGYTGDGFICAPRHQTQHIENCHITQDCSINAICSPSSRGFSCQCLEGYTGNGHVCRIYDEPSHQSHSESSEETGEEESFIDDPNGDKIPPQPECVLDACWCGQGYIFNRFEGKCEDSDALVQVEFGRPKPICDTEKCACPEGFVYNQLYLECDPFDKDVPCDLINNCHRDALCTYSSAIGISRCVCNAGFKGDGFSCSPLEMSCDQVDICTSNAECIYDDNEFKYICICKEGFIGDGFICNSEDGCNSIEDCDPNAQCLFDGKYQTFACRCNSGYEGDGLTCSQGDIGCNDANPCDLNALCIYDAYAKNYQCQCLSGYSGNGFVCVQEEVGCHVQHICGANAHCIFNKQRSSYECICNEGYEGDGIYCRLVYTCLQDNTICDENATCELNQALNMYACVCQLGYTGDGSYCEVAEKFDKDIILISRGLSVLRMPIDIRRGTGYPIHVDPFMTAVGADIDCYAGRFYWTDIDSKSIRSSKYDGSEKKPLLTGGGIGFPEDVAVDWLAKNVFWTDSTNNVVSVVTIEEGMKRTVIEGELVNPRGIAVHPGLGLLFWSDWDRNDPKIESAGMDGSNRKKLVSGSENILLPNSLIVDYETGMICWADAGTHKIECVSMDGHGRRKVIAEEVKYPFGLTLHYRSFYYSDWKDNLIHEVNKYTGELSESLHPPLGGSGKLYGIVAIPERCPPVSNVCQISRGNCDVNHICLPNGRGGRTCSCTDDNRETEICNDIFY